MYAKAAHGGLALLVFVLLSGGLLLATGALSGAKPGGGHDAHDGHDHAGHAPAPPASKPAPSGHDSCNDGCGSAASTKGDVALETRKCEHDIRQLDCNECRYELGAVKLDPSLAKSLIGTARAQTRPVTLGLRLTGQVQADQTRTVEVVPMAAGRIVAIKARLGERVAEGQTLAILHSAELGEAKAAYLESRTAHEIAVAERDRQAALGAAMQELATRLKEGGDGRSADAPAGAVLGEGRSKLVSAAARLSRARTSHERERGLFEKGVSSRAEFEEAVRELRTAEAEMTALVEEAQLNLGLNKLRADSAARQAEAKLAAAEQRLRILGIDDDALTALPARKGNGTFAHLEIKSPRAGTIIAQTAAEGRYVDTTHALFTVCDVSNVWVWCDVYERDLESLHEAMGKAGKVPARVGVAAMPRTPLEGTVDLIGSALDEHTRTVKVRVQVSNPDGRLRAGMFATVEIDLLTGRSGTMVPRSAVLSDEGQAFAFIHWKDDLWLKKDVSVGTAQGDWVEVSGIEAGATVAARGAFMLKSDVLRAKMGAGCAD